MKILKYPWMLPLAFGAIGFVVAFAGVKARPAVGFITSAERADLEKAMRSATTGDKLNAILEKHKLPMAREEFEKRLEMTLVKTDEVSITFDYKDAQAARAVLVDVAKNIGDAVPIVALELGNKKPERSPVRGAMGAVLGAALGVALRILALRFYGASLLKQGSTPA